MINITEIRVNPIDSRAGKLRGFADIVIDECFKVRGMAIIEGDDGCHYVSMPKREKRDGSRIDIAHPIDDATRIELENQILDAYEIELNRRAGNPV